MSTQIANFASCLGKYDGSVLSGSGTMLDPSSVAIGNFDLSLNSGYLCNPNAFTTPNVGNGTGFSVTGWFNPGGAQASNFTPLFDMSGAVVTSTTTTTSSVPPVTAGTCILWLDGSDNSTTNFTFSSGSVISTWNDKSGSGNHMTQSTVANQPTWVTNSLNGRGAVNTGTIGWMQNTTFAFPTTYSIFAVAYTTGTTVDNLLIRSMPGAASYLSFCTKSGYNFDLTGTSGGSWNDIAAYNALPKINSWCIKELTNTGVGSNAITYVNGTSQTTKVGTDHTFTGISLAAINDGTSPWNGYIAEVLIYSSVLSDTDRKSVEGYLATKWNLRGSLPSSHPNYTTGLPYSVTTTVSTAVPATTTLCVSGNSLTPALVATFNAQTSVYVPSGAVNANAWNFFGYTVCCSGGTQLIQNLMVNGTPTSTVGGGTYSAITVANTFVGYGTGIYANYFQGKIDDFRYYGRVLCPMEMRVLYSYAYGKSTVSATAPTLGNVTVGTLTATTAPLIFPSTGTYSYVGVTRTFNGVTTSFNVSPSLMVLSGSNYVWTDTVAFTSSPTAYYVLTPGILGTVGVSQALTATIPAPSAITSVLAYNAGVGMFDVSWIGGAGIGVTYLYDVSSSGAVVASGNYTTTDLAGYNPTRIKLTDTSVKTYTVVVKATNGVGTVVSATSGSITTLSPYTIAVTSYTFNGTAVTTPSGALATTNGVIKGSSTTSAINYNVYAFGQGRSTSDASTLNNYVVNYNVASATSVYVLAVGGGGGSVSGLAGGGGGVYNVVVPVVAGNGSITISVGNGGIIGTTTTGTTAGTAGTNTTVVFSGTPKSGTYSAYGGGIGTSSTGGTSGGTSGGATTYASLVYQGQACEGGGGAGGQGTQDQSYGSSAVGGGGGPGIICSASLNGVKDFSINSLLLSTVYWGGGGGGEGGDGRGGNGGRGGGGFSYNNGKGNPGTAAADGITIGTNGSGGINTGGGSGGQANNNGVIGGTGGSGIVIIAFPV